MLVIRMFSDSSELISFLFIKIILKNVIFLDQKKKFVQHQTLTNFWNFTVKAKNDMLRYRSRHVN